MKEWSELITAVAALLGAVAWPIAILAFLLVFRPNVVQVLERAETLKIGSFFDAKLRAESKALVEQAIAEPGVITGAQIQSTTRIQMAARSIGDDALRAELTRLCIEYENVRSSMPPGGTRTRAMTDILVQMRTLARSVTQFLDELKASDAPGKKLAAIAIMQVEPQTTDPRWITDLFSTDSPFVFFHGAIALQNALGVLGPAIREDALAAAHTGLEVVRSFAGPPDQHTIEVLEGIVRDFK